MDKQEERKKWATIAHKNINNKKGISRERPDNGHGRERERERGQSELAVHIWFTTVHRLPQHTPYCVLHYTRAGCVYDAIMCTTPSTSTTKNICFRSFKTAELELLPSSFETSCFFFIFFGFCFYFCFALFLLRRWYRCRNGLWLRLKCNQSLSCFTSLSLSFSILPAR